MLTGQTHRPWLRCPNMDRLACHSPKRGRHRSIKGLASMVAAALDAGRHDVVSAFCSDQFSKVRCQPFQKSVSLVLCWKGCGHVVANRDRMPAGAGALGNSNSNRLQVGQSDAAAQAWSRSALRGAGYGSSSFSTPERLRTMLHCCWTTFWSSGTIFVPGSCGKG